MCAVASTQAFAQPSSDSEAPNIILIMADDLGYGDTAYNGNPHVQTPNLDQWAQEGIRFTRFYANSPVSSPTRGGCLTGRHPFRYGVFHANTGHLLSRELTLPEILKEHGYATGHFGKWHLGTLTTEAKDGNRGGAKHAEEFSPPWLNGFDRCFTTESKVPTWDPMLKPSGKKNKYGWDSIDDKSNAKRFGTYYWNEKGKIVTTNLEGDDSRVIMDRVIPFIENQTKNKQPFFTVIWFHTPHLPVVAGPEYRALYKDLSSLEQNFFGSITAMDEQIGRLRNKLADLNIDDNTMIWFTSDNGPEGDFGEVPGSSGSFRGRKRSLYEGGVRVPGLFIWPQFTHSSKVIGAATSTLDYFPTILDALGYDLPAAKQYDGISLLPVISSDKMLRNNLLPFESKTHVAIMDDRYKIIAGKKNLDNIELYDLVADPAETTDIASQYPQIVKSLNQSLQDWRESCTNSFNGTE
ncbi:sulfatase-like hydrolase/transferase [Planctomycetota bacterium]|nr:sulfatase-like hydrolase/transferase [Planctomycetota bacterium]